MYHPHSPGCCKKTSAGKSCNKISLKNLHGVSTATSGVSILESLTAVAWRMLRSLTDSATDGKFAPGASKALPRPPPAMLPFVSVVSNPEPPILCWCWCWCASGGAECNDPWEPTKNVCAELSNPNPLLDGNNLLLPSLCMAVPAAVFVYVCLSVVTDDAPPPPIPSKSDDGCSGTWRW